MAVKAKWVALEVKCGISIFRSFGTQKGTRGALEGHERCIAYLSYDLNVDIADHCLMFITQIFFLTQIIGVFKAIVQCLTLPNKRQHSCVLYLAGECVMQK